MTVGTAGEPSAAVIRGRALIFWDPKAAPGTKKLVADSEAFTSLSRGARPSELIAADALLARVAACG